MAQKKKKSFMEKVHSHMAFILSVLIAYLVKDFALYVMAKDGKALPPTYSGTLTTMLLIIVVFYPIYEGLKKASKHFLKGYFEKSEEVAKSKFWGVFIGFSLMFLILFGVYAKVYHGRNIIHDFQIAVGLK